MSEYKNPMGYAPDFKNRKYKEKPGENSVIFEVKGPEKETQPGVIAKLLKSPAGGSMAGQRLSAGYGSMADFRKRCLNELEAEFETLEKYFGESIPPFYVEVKNNGKDVYNQLDAETIMYMEEVDVAPWNKLTEDDKLKFAKQIDDFMGGCQELFYRDLGYLSHVHQLPDIQPAHFVYGNTISKPENRMYFIDLHPPLLVKSGPEAARVVKKIVYHFSNVYDFPKANEFIKKLET